MEDLQKLKKHMETEIQKNKGNWINRANKYLETLKMSWEQLREMDRKELKLKIREWDTESWKKEMSSKSTMKWYLEAKMRIGYDEFYNNNIASKYLARARTNSLQVREMYGRTKENKENNYDTTCQLCGKGEEDLEHFLIKCKKLETKRNKEIMEQLSKIEEKKKIPYLLFKVKKYEDVSEMIYKMWLLRKVLLKPP